jgi:hypothetical protein
VISETYRKEQERLHMNPDYGVASVQFAPLVSQIINKLGVTELLDYGAGKGRLMQNLKVGHQMKVQCYDPGVPDWAESPIPMQMCTCIDVLEHIEPDHLEAVLDDLKRCTQAVGLFTVHTGPAVKTLSDGRNAHLIQEPMEWWLPKFMDRFELQTVQRLPNGFYVIVYAKPQLIEVKNDDQHLRGT